MTRDLCLSKTYVSEVLRKVLKLKKCSLRWVLHTLNDDQNASRVEMAVSMLSILESLTAHAHSWILTEDESWFYFSYDYKGKWSLAWDLSMTKPKALINTPKSWFWSYGSEMDLLWLRSFHEIYAWTSSICTNLHFFIWKPTWKHITQNKASKISSSVGIMPKSHNKSDDRQNQRIGNESDVILSIFSRHCPKQILLFRIFEAQAPRMLLRLSRWTFLHNHRFDEKSRKSLLHRVFDEWISYLHSVRESSGEYIQI
jgi:hypothetical protein